MIDANALVGEFKRFGLGEHSLVERFFADGVYTVIENTPTIDAVPIARCKNCKHFMEYTEEYARGVEKANGDCCIRVMNSDNEQFCGCKYSDFCSYGGEVKDNAR